MRQAWRAKAVSCDAFEQAKIELKSGVETACDRLERERIKADSQARKKAAITGLKRKIGAVASVARAMAKWQMSEWQDDRLVIGRKSWLLSII